MATETLPKWRAAVEQALRFGPSLAEAHVRAAQYHWLTGAVPQADEHFKRAKVLNPSDSLVLAVSAGQAVRQGRLDEAITLQRRAVAIDPLAATYRASLASFLTGSGQLEEAHAEIQKALELSPTALKSYEELCRILILKQRFDEALTAAAQIPDGNLRDACLTLVWHGKGDAGASDTSLARLARQAEQAQGEMAASLAISIAEAYAFRGDFNAAFAVLARTDRQLRASHDVVAQWTMRADLQLSPFLRLLSTDPRWQPLVASPARGSGRPTGR